MAIAHFFQACIQLSTGDAKGTVLVEVSLEIIKAILEIVQSLFISRPQHVLTYNKLR